MTDEHKYATMRSPHAGQDADVEREIAATERTVDRSRPAKATEFAPRPPGER